MKYQLITFLCMSFTIHGCEKQAHIIIRDAQTKDIPSLHALSEKYYHSDFKPLWKKHHTSSFTDLNIENFIQEITTIRNERIRKIISKQNPNERFYFLIAELKDTKSSTEKIVGYCQFKRKTEETIYIQFILIDEEFRKKGLAKKLAFIAMDTFPNTTRCTFRIPVHNEKANEICLNHECRKQGMFSLDPISKKINTNANAPITHYDYEYVIKR